MFRPTRLCGIDKETAVEVLSQYLSTTLYRVHYHAWPQLFSNTAGPFSRKGTVAGAAMTYFTLEAYSVDNYAVIFCDGVILKIVDDFEPVEYTYSGEYGCMAKQYSEQMVCYRCNQRWDINDSCPPECKNK